MMTPQTAGEFWTRTEHNMALYRGLPDGQERWDDLTGPLTRGLQGSADKPDFDYTNFGLLFPQNDTSEIA